MASVLPSSRGASAIVSRVVCRRTACRRRSSLDGRAVGIGTVVAPPPPFAAVLAGRRRSATDDDDGAGGVRKSRGVRSALRRNFTVATTTPHHRAAAAGGGGWRTIVARHSPSSTTTRDDGDGDPPVLRRLRRRRRLRWTDAPSSQFSSAAHRPASPPPPSLDDDDDDDPAGDDGLDSLPALSPAMLGRIRAFRSRHDEVMELLRSEGGGGPDQSALGRELSSLSGLSSACDAVRELHAERRSLAELLDETTSGDGDGGGDDPSSREMIEEIEWELDQIDARLRALSRKMMMSIVPIFDPEDAGEVTSSDAVIDIRAGTGGDEACLFAGEILAAYEAIAKAGGGGDGDDDDDRAGGGKSWDVEVLSVSRTGLGGVKEASLVVSSRGGGGHTGGFDGGGGPEEDDAAGLVLRRLGPYGFFRYESGVHRVQRVPVNDAKMQTSAVSVAVLPSVADSDIATALPSTEIRIDVMRASGAGGQHVNTTESAVRVTHVPTGVVACIQDERSQHKNKAKALKLVAARVHQLRKDQALRDRSGRRSSLMGGGDRSERIRTYNFSQDRITDHRCKVTVQGVQAWLGGGTMVRKFAPYLYEMEREERVVALEEEDEEKEKKDRNAAGRSRKDKAGR